MKNILAIMLSLALLLALGGAAFAEGPGQHKNAVTELYSAEGTYTDTVGNVENYSYHVPQLNVATPAAEEINREIAERFGAIVEAQFENMAGDYSLWSWHAQWHAYWRDNVLFLQLEADENGGFHELAAYGYDFENDRRVTNDMLLAKLGITEEDYMENLREKTALMFEGMYGSIPNKEALGYDELLEKTLNWLDMEQPMFIDGVGQIETIIRFASFAGAEWYYHLVTPFAYG